MGDIPVLSANYDQQNHQHRQSAQGALQFILSLFLHNTNAKYMGACY